MRTVGSGGCRIVVNDRSARSLDNGPGEGTNPRPTDPIAVLGILKTAGAPKNLELVIAGESLFNDGVGVVIQVEVLLTLAAVTDGYALANRANRGHAPELPGQWRIFGRVAHHHRREPATASSRTARPGCGQGRRSSAVA